MKETTKFANEILEIPLQVVITVPSDYKSLKATSDNNLAAVVIIVSLLIIVTIIALVWKIKSNKQNQGSFFLHIKLENNLN